MTDEELIESVRQHPVLYDMSLVHYRDYNIRNNTWEDIAKQMKTTPDDVKNRWGRLRNCYTNALKRRRKKGHSATIHLIPWKFEKQMEFLLPHLEERKAVPNLVDSDDDSIQDYEIQLSEESPVLHPTFPQSSTSREYAVSAFTDSPIRSSKRTHNECGDNLLRDMIDVMKSSLENKKKRAATDMDENDYFFLSMSKQLKKLPKVDQAVIKFQLHKLIFESEMKMLKSKEH